jgi:hypothetical protein
MSGIRSTQGPPPANLDTGRVNSTAQQQPVTPVAPTSQPGGHSGTAVTVASSIASLSEGAEIAAIVTARTSVGTVIFNSDIGSFSMTVNGPIPVGSQLVLEISGLDQVIHAKLLSKDGTPFNPPINVSLTPAESAQLAKADGYQLVGKQYLATHQPTSQSLPDNLQTLTKGGQQTGPTAQTVAQPGSQVFASTPTNPGLRPTISLSSNLLNATGQAGNATTNASGVAMYSQTPAPGTTAGQRQAATQQPNLSQQASVSAGPVTGQSPTISTEHMVRALVNTLPSNTSLRPAALAAVRVGDQIPLNIISTDTGGTLHNTRGLLTGTVVATTNSSSASGPTVHLQSSAGQFSFSTSASITTGSQIQFSLPVQPTGFPLPPVAVASNFVDPTLLLTSDWQNLRDAINIIAQTNSSAAQHFLSNLVPQANNQLSGSLLFFVAALQLGNFENWVGRDMYQMLQAQGQTTLLLGLEEDFTILQRLATEPGNNDWRHLLFPFFDGQNLKQLGLYYRHHNSNTEDSESEKSTRFVIDLDLSKSGPIQLDGLFNERKFDLFLRSHRDLDDKMRMDIGSIFTENLEITGISGQLIFQTISPFPVNPGEEMEELAHPQLDV